MRSLTLLFLKNYYKTKSMYQKHRLSETPFLWLFLGTITTLLTCGLIFVYSASSVYALERLGSAHYYAQKHIIGLVVGSICMFIILQLPIMFIRQMTPYGFLFSICLTSLTKIPMLSQTIYGSSRWLHIGPITFQPSELLKYTFVLYMAYFLSKKRDLYSLNRSIAFFTILIITSIILLLQPDFGMTVTLCLTGIFMAFIAGLNLKHLGITFSGLIPIALILIYIKPYRFKRIMTFLDPWSDPQGAGFQIIQSFIAIGSGKFWGIGIGQSKQKFFYLPMQHTDFIFSIIAEEIGFAGSFCIITLFILMLYAGLRLALTQEDLFARYTICGFVILLSLQASINIAVATGLVPTKGLGLPFISYGNSSLVSTLAMLGVVIRLIRD